MNALLKLLGSILVWASLGLGAVSAANAYLPRTTLFLDDPEVFLRTPADESETGEAEYMEIVAPAGPMVSREGKSEPLFPEGTELTPETLERMIGENPDEPLVQRVKVGEFSLGRWSHKYHFFGAVAGLAIGGLVVRWMSKPKEMLTGEQPVEETPTGAVDAALAAVRSAQDEAPQQSDLGEALRLITLKLGETQQTHILSFAAARDALIARYGLGTYARIMDRFAAAERQINRGWSAAADGRVGPAREAADQYAESLECLEKARVALEELRSMLS